MKHIPLLLISLSLCVSQVQAQSYPSRVTTYEIPDFFIPIFKPINRRSFVYNNQNKVTSEILEFWKKDTETWINITRVLNTYDEKDRLTESIRQKWAVTYWQETGRTQYMYEANDNPYPIEVYEVGLQLGNWFIWEQKLTNYTTQYKVINQSIEKRNNTLDTLSLFYSYSAEFDSMGNILVSTDYYFQPTYTSGNRFSYTYDANNRRTYHLTEKNSGPSTPWRPNSQSFFYHQDADNFADFQINQRWFTPANQWINDERVFNTRDSTMGIRLVRTIQDSSNTGWYNYSRQTQLYHPNGDLVSDQNELWSRFDSNWVWNGGVFAIFDTINARIDSVKYYLPEVESQTIYYSNYKVYEYSLVGTHTIPSSISAWAYPNPVMDFLFIEMAEEVTTKPTKVSLLDVQGRLLERKTIIGNKGQFDMRNAPSGVYYVSIEQSDSIKAFTITKM